MAAEFVLPLPCGATVTGLAVDVAGGEFVEGTVVDKAAATASFEAEKRQGRAASLAENVAGTNLFRARISLFPRKGHRSVQVKFIQQTAHSGGKLRYKTPFRLCTTFEISAIVEVPTGSYNAASLYCKQGKRLLLAKVSKITDGATSVFLSRYSIEYRSGPATGVQGGALTVTVRQTGSRPSPMVLLENRSDADDDSDSTFFAVKDTSLCLPPCEPSSHTYTHIGVMWDVSASRSPRTLKREIQFLANVLEAEKTLEKCSLIVVDESLHCATFNDPKTLPAFLLSHTMCSGGTALSAAVDLALTNKEGCQTWLLFSDGIATWGPPLAVKESNVLPIHTVTASKTANFAVLQMIATRTGGSFSKLSNSTPTEPLLSSPQWAVSHISGTSGEPLDAAFGYLADGFTLVGRLPRLVADVTVTAHFSNASQSCTREYKLRQDMLSKLPGSRLVRMLWAKTKADAVSLTPGNDTREINKLSKQYHFATLCTSLLVLETLEQYLQYGVEPPESLPALRRGYLLRKEEQRAVQAEAHTKHQHNVLEMWRRRVAWQKMTYKHTADTKEPQLLRHFLKLDCDNWLLQETAENSSPKEPEQASLELVYNGVMASYGDANFRTPLPSLSPSCGSLLTICVGGVGARIGDAFFSLLQEEHNCSFGVDNDSAAFETMMVKELGGGLHPRCVIVADYNELHNAKTYDQLPRECVISTHEKSGLFSDWQYLIGPEVAEMSSDVLRKQVEACDIFEGTLTLHSLYGGAGSGFTSLLLEQLNEQYPDKSVK
eukprot:TRINITY_DN1549_c0_g2_i2.p1 TRINITY_DN1549_c0_g2~~TRINITY_DN1549_c0_g2_i2.p1  ORF type:complete len:840 (-),score=106.60 TRINITY_DN1549_c0_g2_i2:1834-4155(-)